MGEHRGFDYGRVDRRSFEPFGDGAGRRGRLADRRLPAVAAAT